MWHFLLRLNYVVVVMNLRSGVMLELCSEHSSLLSLGSDKLHHRVIDLVKNSVHDVFSVGRMNSDKDEMNRIRSEREIEGLFRHIEIKGLKR